ncbi:UKL1 [Scenedesmus sp. PABB004]|nr:UKL1 [Scenedesmus sp. PABB004]
MATPEGSSPRSGSGGKRRTAAPFLIGVAGGTASGKTTVCSRIMHRLNDQAIALIHQDRCAAGRLAPPAAGRGRRPPAAAAPTAAPRPPAPARSFYRPLTDEERRDVSSYNFDHPDAFDHDSLMRCLADLQAGRSVEVPVYDFARHARSSEVRKVEPADVVIVEGILVLHVPELRAALNMRVYVDTDDDVRLARRIQRDVQARGRDVAGVIEQYTRFVKPSFDQFVAPSRRFADVIIPWQRGDNIVAIDVITEHIRTKLQQHSLRRIYPNLEVMPSNYQIRGMHTILRDASTSKNDFVFYADRLNRLVVEAGLGLLPFSEKTIVTPTGHAYVGVDFARKLCGVSIIRSGESMEAALRTCCKGIKIGKILVVRHHGQPLNGGTSRASSTCVSPLLGPSAAAAAGGSGSWAGPAPSPRSPPTPSGGQQQQQQQLQQGQGQQQQRQGQGQGQQRQGQQGQQPPPSQQPHQQQAAPPLAGGGGGGGRGGDAGAGAAALRALGRSTEGAALSAATAAFGGLGLLSPGSQDVIYEKLPADIAQRHVLLMDPVLSTGNSACRAVEVLLDRGVAEERVFLLSIIAAPEGIRRVCGRFPAMRLVTSEIDDGVDEHFAVVPGCGEFGDRYFCE